MKINKKAVDTRKDKSVRLAGGYGNAAASQGPAGQLRRAVMACMLWESVAYEGGHSVANHIAELIPQVSPEEVFQIAQASRHEQGLRHIPLFIAVHMLRWPEHRKYVAGLLQSVITRADMITDALALYWEVNGAGTPIAKQMKRGLAEAFLKFDAYQFAKYDRDNQVKLRDVMQLVHPKPRSQPQTAMFEQILTRTLPTPDTWEVAISATDNKCAEWTRLLDQNRLGGMALLRNLRNMEEAGVDRNLIRAKLNTLKDSRLLPINYIAAAQAVPRFEAEIEQAMFRGLAGYPRLSGRTLLIVDVSGSMGASISEKSDLSRLDVAAAVTALTREICDDATIYVTAGVDHLRKHDTMLAPPRRGFALADFIKNRAQDNVGYGGIFTRQALEYCRGNEQGDFDRIIVFSDSQDCDYPHLTMPAPFGRHNYIVNVSANTRGIAYRGVWDVEISGWSPEFLRYIAAVEGLLQ